MRHVTPADPANGILDFPKGLERFQLQRFPPAEDLRAWIEGYWVVAWDLPPGQVHRQLNVSHASITIACEPEGPFLYGVPNRTFEREIRGTGAVFGVKFRPGGFFPFWNGGSLRELMGKRVPLQDALGGPAGEWTRGMTAAGDEGTRAALTDELWRNLRRASPERFTEAPAAATAAAERIIRDHSILSVGMAAESCGLSIRGLERRFTREVGIGPKEVIRRFRLQEAAERLLREPATSCSQIALELGYFDQAHFIRDFKAVAGVSPEVYRQRQRKP